MSGAGKDILVYNVVSEIRKRYPQAYIIGIDGKNAPIERPLWDRALYNETIHFSMGNHPSTYHDRLMQLLDKVDDLPPMTFYVFSEVNGTRDSYISDGMGQQWNEVANKIRYIALQLNYAQKFMIATAQTANKQELGIGDGRQNVNFCLVSNGQQQSFISAVAKASVFEGNGVKDTGSWQSAISRSNALDHLHYAAQAGGVAYFHSALGRWLPMPRLHNAGGDRGVPGSNPQPTQAIVEKPIEQPVRQRPQIEVEPDEPLNAWEARRPKTLSNFAMAEAICLYLEGKEPRSLKQISNTMKNCGKISDQDLQQRLGVEFTNYKEGIQKILFFGVQQGFIKQISNDAFTVNY